LKKDTPKLGQILVAGGLIDEWQLQLGLRAHKRGGSRIGQTLVDGEFISEDDLLQALSGQLNCPFVDLTATGPTVQVGAGGPRIELGDPTVLETVPAFVARCYAIFPLLVNGGDIQEIVLAMATPRSTELLGELRWLLGARITGILATDRGISEAITRFYPTEDDPSESRLPLPHDPQTLRNVSIGAVTAGIR
jgi:MSHA biogenesis protein MshE